MTKERASLSASARHIFLIAIVAGGSAAASAAPAVVELPGDRAFPESITSTSDGALYIGSFAKGAFSACGPAKRKLSLGSIRCLR